VPDDGWRRVPDLSRLLAPRSVAVVGATDRVGSYAGQTLRNLSLAGFPGPVHGVHPRRREVLGYACVPALADLPGPVDAVVLGTPAETVAGYLEEIGRMGCGGAVVYAAGFAETGHDAAQRAAVRSAAAHALPVLGPNCNGVVAVPSRAPLWGDAVRLPAVPGPVALVTQSGNLGVVALAHRGGYGLHTVVSLGNAAVVDGPAAVEYLAAADGVGAIALYLEDDGDGVRWAQALAACAARDVRVVVLKVGRSVEGRAAGSAHTAALAGDHRVFEALFAEAGAVCVDELADLLETARALATARRDPRGAAVLTCSGGDAAMAADLAADTGLPLAALEPDTVAAVQALLPEGVAVGNPLDHTNAVWADTGAVAAITAAVAADPGVGHLVYVQDAPPGQAPEDDAEWAATRNGAVAGARRAGTEAMLVATCPGMEPPGAIAGLRPALAALAAVRRPAADPARLRAIAVATRTARRRAGGPRPAGPLAEHQAKDLLEAAGIPVPRRGLALDPATAAAAAERVGLPVALKVSALGLVHKTEAGALALGLADVGAVSRAAERLLSLPDLPAGAVLLVERMAPPGQDVLVAARADGVVPCLVLGLGGVWTEALDDVAVLPLPAGPDQVIGALRGLRAAPLLFGGRRHEALAVRALAELASAVGNLLLAEHLSLVEINPVRLTPEHALALDAVIRYR
jgi:acetate---CoA ligase (ADP-forming)